MYVEVSLGLQTSEELVQFAAFSQAIEKARLDRFEAENKAEEAAEAEAKAKVAPITFPAGARGVLVNTPVEAAVVTAPVIEAAIAVNTDPVSDADLESAVRNHLNAKGMAATVAALAGFGVKRASEIPAERRAAFVALLRAAA